MLGGRSLVVASLFVGGCSSGAFAVAPSNDDSGSSATDSGAADSTIPGDAASDSGTTPGEVGLVDAIVPPLCPQGCDLGFTCVSGSCQCLGTMCGSKCVDLDTDPANCGECNQQVCHGEVCVGGRQACIPLLTPCGGSGGCLGCAAVKVDPAHCGGCGVKCGLGQRCKVGNCTSETCGTGLSECATLTSGIASCTDLQIDPANCGTCGKQCAPTQYCSQGKCIDYVGAPGCNACPCPACSGSDPSCCSYAKATICSDGNGVCPP